MASSWLVIISVLIVLHLHQQVNTQIVDVSCLEQFKKTVIDPNNYLSSWTFTNITSDVICQQYYGVQCLHPSQISVYSLLLPGMGLGGTFPQGLENCTSLTSLDLSSNAFTGPIPEKIGTMLPQLVKLDLSLNHLGGQIPTSLGNCTYLNALKLQKNELTGPIPGQIGILDRLKDVDFSSNRLTGLIPYTFAKVPAQAFQGNPGLCGVPLSSACIKSSKSDTSTGLAVGVFVTGVLAAVAVAGCCIVFQKKRGRALIRSDENMWVRQIKAPRTIAVSMFRQPLVNIGVSDLMAATNNFSRDSLINIGQTGVSYKATLRDGSVLAIKRLRPSPYSDQQFRVETETLGKVRHCNLVPLLGYCVAGAERLLVYKHMTNGSLHNRLHESGDTEKLDWPARLNIGIGAARGLAWLHHCCNPCIIHCNISSSSILLGEDFDARITDFGLARLMTPVDTPISTCVNGDFADVGYVAPEYARTQVATVRGDVYSFGVVLLELVTGQKPVDINVEGDFKGTLVEWVGMLSSNGSIKAAIDKSLQSEGIDNELVQVLRAGCACVLSPPKERPSMYELFQLLRVIGEKYQFIDQDEVLPILSQTVDIHADELIVSRGTDVFHKATLRDGSGLADKRSRPSPHNDRQFQVETENLGKVRHWNLVPLLAERPLIYKHMINGSLPSRRHESAETEKLDWPARLNIGTGAAGVLAWFHHSCNPCIIHCNYISSSSILLGEDFDARITNFGLARLMDPIDTHISTYINGHFGDVGYVAPKYARTLVATAKAGDVCSFVAVLPELVTGQKPVDINVEGDFKRTSLKYVGMQFSNEIIKKAIEGVYNELVQVLRVGCACALSQPKERKSMYEVFQLLRAIEKKYQCMDQNEDQLPILSQIIDIDADKLINVSSQKVSRNTYPVLS